jgi:Flp pilus assembly protein TadB
MHAKQIFIFLIIFAIFSSFGCQRMMSRSKQRRDLREIEQKQREQDKEKLAKYQEAVKRHASNQDKKTRKSMKKQYKKAQRHNNNQKEFFVKRWFSGKKRLQSNPQRKNRE